MIRKKYVEALPTVSVLRSAIDEARPTRKLPALREEKTEIIRLPLPSEIRRSRLILFIKRETPMLNSDAPPWARCVNAALTALAVAAAWWIVF